MLVDHDGLLAYASPSLQRWLGYDPDELIGTVLGLSGHADDELALVSHPEDEAALAQAFERRLLPSRPQPVGIDQSPRQAQGRVVARP